MIGCALALIALAGCKTPELSMDERISLPESGEMGMNDTTFVKPLSWDVFFQDTLLRGYVDVALRNNHSFRQSMERIAMSRAALRRAKGLLLPDVNLNIGASVNRFGEYTMDGVGNSETNVPSLPKDKHCLLYTSDVYKRQEQDGYDRHTEIHGYSHRRRYEYQTG